MGEIDKLFDENNNENIILFNEKGEEIAFEQIAIIPIKERIFCILKPVILISGMDPAEGLVFEVVTENEEEKIVLVTDETIIDEVFDIYLGLIEKDDEIFDIQDTTGRLIIYKEMKIFNVRGKRYGLVVPLNFESDEPLVLEINNNTCDISYTPVSDLEIINHIYALEENRKEIHDLCCDEEKESIFLCLSSGIRAEFKEIAYKLYNNKAYTILKPVEYLEELEPYGLLILEVVVDNDVEYITPVLDDNIIKEVYELYCNEIEG